MKHLYIIILLAILMPSCNALDLTPEDYYGSESFWKSESQVDMYVTGLYAELREKYDMPVTLGEFRGETLISDVTCMGQGAYGAPMTNNMLTKDNTGIEDWFGLYPNIMHINLLIKKLEDADYVSNEKKSSYLGQAYGLRAFYYFYLYCTYGGVPLETEAKVVDGNIDPSQLYKERATPEQVLNQIKGDIKLSEENFNNTNKESFDKYEWTYYSTELLKAKVYLWSAKVTTGDHKASLIGTDPNNSDIITAREALLKLKGKFTLVNNFQSIWDALSKNNNEVIFSIKFDKTEMTNWGGNWLYSTSLFSNATDLDGNPLNGDPLNLLTAGPLRYEYKTDFIQQYSNDDTRLNSTFFQFYLVDDNGNKTQGSCLTKIMGHTEGGIHYFDSDIIIYRYADVILMLAECENALNNFDGCASYINDIRNRAYGLGHSHTYTKGDFYENEWAILQERDKEFTGEGHRWFDLLRLRDTGDKPFVFSAKANYGKTTPILNTEDAYKQLWPINIEVMNSDPLIEQTPGYDK
jgi:hypothetical protein